MDRVRPGRGGGLQDGVGSEITLRRRGGSDVDGLVRLGDMERVAVRIGIDGDGLQPQPMRGAPDAAGDLAAIGNQ